MEEAKKKFKNVFLFYWVDGFFVSGKENEVKEFFNTFEYPCKIEKVTDLKVTKNGNYLIFKKEGELKYMPRPTRKKITNKELINFLKGQ